jgi:hypothetical protein
MDYQVAKMPWQSQRHTISTPRRVPLAVPVPCSRLAKQGEQPDEDITLFASMQSPGDTAFA